MESADAFTMLCKLEQAQEKAKQKDADERYGELFQKHLDLLQRATHNAWRSGVHTGMYAHDHPGTMIIQVQFHALRPPVA